MELEEVRFLVGVSCGFFLSPFHAVEMKWKLVVLEQSMDNLSNYIVFGKLGPRPLTHAKSPPSRP